MQTYLTEISLNIVELKIFNKIIGKKPKVDLDLQAFSNFDIENLNLKSAPIWISGCGRSGTHFMAKLFSNVSAVEAYHLDSFGDPIGEAFEWYSRWYGLPVDHLSYEKLRGFFIHNANLKGSRYLESNPMMALSMPALYEKYGGKLVIIVRNPKKVVRSHFAKGWYYSTQYTNGEIPGYRYDLERPNHYFSRIEPTKVEERKSWHTLTRVGKIAWMWRSVYDYLIQKLPHSEITWVEMDNFGFKEAQALSGKLGLETFMSSSEFENIVKSKPGKGKNIETDIFRPKEKKEFNMQVNPIIKNLSGISHLEFEFDKWLF